MPSSRAQLANPEFNWMAAVCHFVGRNYAAAEAPLLRVLRSPAAVSADRRTAARALIGVYLKTGRKVEALRAALVQELITA